MPRFTAKGLSILGSVLLGIVLVMFMLWADQTRQSEDSPGGPAIEPFSESEMECLDQILSDSTLNALNVEYAFEQCQIEGAEEDRGV